MTKRKTNSSKELTKEERFQWMMQEIEHKIGKFLDENKVTNAEAYKYNTMAVTNIQFAFTMWRLRKGKK